MSTRCLLLANLCVGLSLGAWSGCGPKTAGGDASPAPVVAAAVPITRDVRDYVDFTGRTDAIESVDVRARVTGYLNKVVFPEGFEVRKGDLLFEIDPRPFQAAYDQTLAQIKVRQADLTQRKSDFERGKALLPQNAIAESDYDQVVAQYGEAVASVAAAEAAAAGAKLNLDFATITSPIDGRTSKTDVTAGNLVNADVTLLTTVVSQDPIYVYFDVDERTMLRVVRMQMKAKENLLKTKQVPLLMGVADEEGFPHTGYVNFADNALDSSTGTVTARGVFANPASEAGVRLLRPGMFVRVRLPLGEPQKRVLVAERALATDQGRKYLLTVDERNVVQYRPVEVGPLQDDGLRVILSGLRADERVIVSGLQLVRARMEVQVQEVPMLAAPEGAAAPAQDKQGTKPTAPAPALKT